MKTIEEVINYLERKKKQYDDIECQYEVLYKNAVSKEAKKKYKELIHEYSINWQCISIALQDIKD